MSLVLSELNIPLRPIPTAENELLFDQLREQILIWFNLQKHLKKKEAVILLKFFGLFFEKNLAINIKLGSYYFFKL